MKCTCLICEVKGEFTESTDVICRPCYDAAMNEKNLAEAALVKFEQLAAEERQGLEAELALHRWTLASEERPKTRQRVYVICKTKEGKRFATMAEYIASRTVLQEDYIDEDYSDCWFDYDEEADIYWTPGGWYEWQSTPDVNWFLTDAVTHWKPITLPGKE